RTTWITTADAPRLSPWVVVAPQALVRDHPELLLAWTEAWLAGIARVRSDVPAAARAISAIDGAPPVVELMRDLGQIEHVSLLEAAQLSGLSGRPAITLEALFSRAWAIDRALGILSSPAPERVPLATGPLSILVRRERPTEPVGRSHGSGSTLLARFPIDLSDRARLVDEEARLGFLAGLFPRSPIRLVAPRERRVRAGELIARVAERYGLDPTRFTVTRGTTSEIAILRAE
ncbi:MAG: hypothetical protein M3Y87_17935, partial [Myxococcota bacterium]|nr:hypothetical protein [Myxococcota bacterium]